MFEALVQAECETFHAVLSSMSFTVILNQSGNTRVLCREIGGIRHATADDVAMHGGILTHFHLLADTS